MKSEKRNCADLQAVVPTYKFRTPKSAQSNFQPLEAINRPTLDTASAAFYLNRRPQTLRSWACLDTGPLRPIRINNRLAWSVADLRRLVQAA